MVAIKLHIHSDKKVVKIFLEELKEILNADDFNIERNMIIVKSSKDEIEYSTSYAMLDLEYDSFDVVERLKELTISEYSETLVDRDDDNPPLLFVFGKDINNKLIYIKLKIKEEITKKYYVCRSITQNMIWSSHINNENKNERGYRDEYR